jgi:Flp pilus assembly protein TadB
VPRIASDTIRAGAGIEHALTQSAGTCPAALRPQVTALVARLRARQPTEAALRAFADELADPTADLIVAALILSASRRGRGLANVLTGLATTVAEEVMMRRQVEADRAKPRTTARAVTAITLAVAGGLIVLDRAYVAPFGSPLGQLVLALVIAIFAAAFWWLRVLATGRPAARFLPADQTGLAGRHQAAPLVGDGPRTTWAVPGPGFPAGGMR